MSFIVKGVDLPKDYNEPLMIEIYSDGDALVTTKEMSGYDKTEAIQIPKGHGRLIDEKEILSPVLCRPKSLRLDSNAQYNIVTLIDEASTILKAEEWDDQSKMHF